jgi:hypothetical protein
MLFEKFDEYYQKLLTAQFQISEIIEHSLTKWQIREDFLKSIITSQFPNLQIVSWIITNDIIQSPQTDLIITKHNCRTRQLWQYNLVNIDDCRMIVEVKSNATGADFKKFNTDIWIIKSLWNENLICWLFCYKLDLQLKTVLERFGYKYNTEYKTYEKYNHWLVKYPNINFVVSIDSFNEDDKEIFIIYNPEKDNWADVDRWGYSYVYEKPSVKPFFELLNWVNKG